MAFCLCEQGKTAEAIAQWRHALDLWRDSLDANAGLGMALYVTGEQEEGRSKYAAAVAKDQGYQDEDYLQNTRFWSDKAIADSRPLR